MNPQFISPATLANWRSAPFNRWAFQHVRELIPSADIPNDPRRVREFESRPRELELAQFLAETDTDALVILHRGRLVAEHYANAMTFETPHILMSVWSPMMGLLFAQLNIEPERPVRDELPDLKSTAYRNAPT